MSTTIHSSILTWVCFFIPALVWGFSFQMMKWGLEAFSSYQLASIRIISAGLCLIPFVFYQFKKVSKQDLFWISLSAMTGSFFPFYLFCIAETQIDATTTGILNSTTPIWALFIGFLFFRHHLKLKQLLGVVTGFLSVLLIILSEQEIKSSHIGYASLILLATLGYAINVWVLERKLSHLSVLTIATFSLTIFMIPALIIFLMTDYRVAFNHPEFLTSLGASLFLGIVGTAFVGFVFYQLIKSSTAIFASMVTYAVPVVVISTGIVVGEQVTVWQIIGMLGILAGVYLCNPAQKL